MRICLVEYVVGAVDLGWLGRFLILSHQPGSPASFSYAKWRIFLSHTSARDALVVPSSGKCLIFLDSGRKAKDGVKRLAPVRDYIAKLRGEDGKSPVFVLVV